MPAVKGTTSILDAAYTSSEVKRITTASSIVATIPVNAFLGPSDKVFDGQKKVPLQSGPYPSELRGYIDSKVRALAAMYDFTAKTKPQFDVIDAVPSLVTGKNDTHH